MSNESHEKGIEAGMAEIAGTYNSRSAFIDAIKAYLDASGMVLVPKEPTEEMLGVGYAIGPYSRTAEIWESIIEAASNPFESKQGE